MTESARQLDLLMLSASSESQAQGYRAELNLRTTDGRLPKSLKWTVVADPEGSRIGSGGSTLLCLDHARDVLGAADNGTFEGKRICIIHCGGDSKRLPAYAAHGKVFTPLPVVSPTGPPVALFDLILSDLLSIRTLQAGSVLVASGDVHLGLASFAIDLRNDGLTAIGSRLDLKTATRHGVFVLPDNAPHQMLQKPTVAQLHQSGACFDDLTALVDTGVIMLSHCAARDWLSRAAAVNAGKSVITQLRAGSLHLDLYADMLPQSVASDRNAPWAITPCKVEQIEPCEFMHIGTSRQLLEWCFQKHSGRESRRTLRAWAPDSVGNDVVMQDACVLMDAGASIQGRALIDASIINSMWSIGDECIIVGVNGAISHPVTLPDRTGITQLPIDSNASVTIGFGIDDDMKAPLDALLIDHWSRTHQPAFSGDQDERSLWTARLWVPGKGSLQHAVSVLNGESVSLGNAVSCAEIMPRVHHGELAHWRESCVSSAAANHMVDDILNNPSTDVRSILSDPEKYAIMHRGARWTSPLLHAFVSRIKSADAVVAARLHAAMELCNLQEVSGARDSALDGLARAIARANWIAPIPEPLTIPIGTTVVAQSPARIDFAGGWSDTPPICIERGGCVFNAAVQINNAPPIRIELTPTSHRTIEIISEDLGCETILDNTDACIVQSARDDWAALPKSALAIAGVIPTSPSGKFSEFLTMLGCGLRVRMSSALPKGSGLGTSSTLAATLIAAIDHARSLPIDLSAIIERTSRVEQFMQTGGGWQDQAGSITPGFTLCESEPGMRQIPRVTALHPPHEFLQQLQQRSVLWFTGIQRHAHDILSSIVIRYLQRDPVVFGMIDELKHNARAAAAFAKAGDFDAFVGCMRTYWLHKRTLDPNAITPEIMQALAPVEDLLDAWQLPGAGGGGYAFMIARDPEAAIQVRDHFRSTQPNPHSTLAEWSIDQHGLRVFTQDA